MVGERSHVLDNNLPSVSSSDIYVTVPCSNPILTIGVDRIVQAVPESFRFPWLDKNLGIRSPVEKSQPILICGCDCDCQVVCFCNTILCSNCKEPIPQLSSNYQLQYDFKKMAIDLMLYLHSIRHVNFAKIKSDLLTPEGPYALYTDDVYRINQWDQFMPQILSALRLIGPRRFRCFDCLRAHLKARPHIPTSSENTGEEAPFEDGGMDIIGPFAIPSYENKNRYCFIYFSKSGKVCAIWFTANKTFSSVVAALRYVHLYARDAGFTMKRIHFDADAIFEAAAVIDFLREHNISPYYSSPGQHWVSGLTERFIQTACFKSKSFMVASHLPFNLYQFAIQYAILVYMAFTKCGKFDSSGREMTVWELMKKVRLSTPIPVFGQLIYARIPNAEQLPKFSNRARACAFLGIKEDHYHSFILFALDTGHVVYSNDVQIVYNTYAYQLRPIVPGLPQMHIGEPTTVSSRPRSDGHTFDSIMPAKRSKFDASTDPNNDEYFDDAGDYQENFRVDYQRADFSPNDVLYNFVHIMLYTGQEINNAQSITSHHFVSGLPPVQMQRLPNRANLVLNTRMAVQSKPRVPYYERIYSAAEQLVAYNQASPTKAEIKVLRLIYAAKAKKAKLVNGTLHLPPSTLKQALMPPYAELFIPAMKKEISNLVSKGCFEEQYYTKSELPMVHDIVNNRFDFNYKTNSTATTLLAKARLIAQGQDQIANIHYIKSYAPTAWMETIRLLFYFKFVLGWSSFCFDAVTAFINAPLQTDFIIYTPVPFGHHHYSESEERFLRLLKALYGLKQAAERWYEFLIRCLLEAGYQRTVHDKCCFVYVNAIGQRTFVATWVDDMPGVSEDPEEGDRLFAVLSKYMELTRSENWDKILGMLIHTDLLGNTIIFNDLYFLQLLANLKLENIKTRHLPHLPNVYYGPNTVGVADKTMHSEYRTIIGSSMHATRMWYPVINFIVNHLSRFVNNPAAEHYDAAVYMLGYVKANLRAGISFMRNHRIHLPTVMAVSDSNWAGDQDRRSISGNIISIHDPNKIEDGILNAIHFPSQNLIHWSSKRQTEFMADSAPAGEMYAGAQIARTIQWFRGLLEDLSLTQLKPTLLLTDSKQMQINAMDNKSTSTMRHHSRIQFQLQDHVETGRLYIHHIPGPLNDANGFTKPEGPKEFARTVARTMSSAPPSH